MLPQFQSDVIKPMQLDAIIDQDVKTLSGGELQRVALCLCLGTPADIYLIDEPSGTLFSLYAIAKDDPDCSLGVFSTI